MLSAIVHAPEVVLAWVVDRLRRLPGAELVGRLVPWAVGLLVVAAVVVLVGWMIQPSPQRMTLAELAAGQLSRMQSWIIVSGELREDPASHPGVHSYRLTDGTPNAHLVVRSGVPLAEGQTTVSGLIEGGRDPVPAGYEWSARLHADRVLASEQPPPWLAILFVIAAVVIAVGSRSRYPVFVHERPRGLAGGRRGELRVGIRRETDRSDEPPTPARLDLGRWPGDAILLRIAGAEPVALRLHSAHTSVDVGLLRWLRGSEPALRVRAPAEDFTIGFESRDERDATHAALAAEVEGRTTGSGS